MVTLAAAVPASTITERILATSAAPAAIASGASSMCVICASRTQDWPESFSRNRRLTGSGSSSETSPPSIATSLASDDDTNE